MKNIHITLTSFRHESRILKEISSLEQTGIFNEFLVIARCHKDLPRHQKISSQANLVRVVLNTRGLPKSFYFQGLKFFEYILKCFLLVKQEKAQVVTIHDLSLLPLGWLLKKVLKIRLVYDAHELETEKNGLHGISQKIARFIERQFVASVDLMTVASDSIADWYEKAYISCRPAIIKNAPRLRTNQKTNLFREKLGISQHQRIFLYQGGLVQGRGIQLILDAFKVRSQKNAVLVFLGYGNLATEIKEASLLYSNIFYVPAVPPDDLLEYTASADFGVALIQDTCLCDYYCMPNKLFEYAMAALPVLISNMKDMAEAVELHQFGTVLSEYSVKSLNIAIDNLCSSDSSELSDNAYNYASANSWEQQEKILIKEYSNLLLR